MAPHVQTPGGVPDKIEVSAHYELEVADVSSLQGPGRERRPRVRVGTFVGPEPDDEDGHAGKAGQQQRMLESVVVADYMGMGRSAEALSRLSYTEIVSWQTAPQSEYVKQAKVFVMSVRRLQEAATKRDIAAKEVHDPHFQLHPMPHVRAALQTGVIRRMAPGLEGASS